MAGRSLPGAGCQAHLKWSACRRVSAIASMSGGPRPSAARLSSSAPPVTTPYVFSGGRGLAAAGPGACLAPAGSGRSGEVPRSAVPAACAGLGPGRRLRTAWRGTFTNGRRPRRPRRLRTVHDPVKAQQTPGSRDMEQARRSLHPRLPPVARTRRGSTGNRSVRCRCSPRRPARCRSCGGPTQPSRGWQDWPLPSGKCNCVRTVVALGHEHDQRGGQGPRTRRGQDYGHGHAVLPVLSIESAFSPSTFSDKTFVRTTGLFLLLLLLSTVLAFSIR